MADRARNPFHYGELAVDEAFTDRKDELRELKSDIRNGQNVAIIAPRRLGKSSLVRRASQELLREGILVAEVDLMRTPTKEKLAAKLAAAIHDDISSVVFKAKERLRVFGTLRIVPTVTVNPDTGSTSFSFTGSRTPEDIDATLERLLELPAQLAEEHGKTLVLYLDEFQEITDIDPALPALMRAIFQEQPNVAHVYSGSRRHMMLRLFTDENEPFFRSAKIVELGVIPPPLFKGFLERQFERTERGLADGVVDALLAITEGHPYATQELAYALWEEVPHGFTATAADLDRALEAVLRSENAHFTLVWENASRTQRVVLQALAAEPGRLQANDYRLRHGLPATSSVQRATEALVAAELIARVDGVHRIVEPFLREWILRSER